MYKWYQDLVQYLDENVDENLEDLYENLTWLTQKTEDPKGIKGTLLSPHTHTVNVIELNCKVIKKWPPPPPPPPPHFYIKPPFSGLSPLSSKTFCTPLSDSIFGRSYHPSPPPLLIGWGRVSTMNQDFQHYVFNAIFLLTQHSSIFQIIFWNWKHLTNHKM